MHLNQFKNQVRQNEITPDAFWYNECFAINVQYAFDTVTKDKFRNLQKSILHESSEQLLFCPPDTLHLSLTFILAAKEDLGLNKKKIWEGIKHSCIESLKNIALKQRPIQLMFNEIIATNQAVIVVANDAVEVNSLRETIKHKTPVPNETENNSTIAHTTLFRFQSKLQNPLFFQDILDQYMKRITVKVDRYTLIKELRYPSIETEIIEIFPFENK